MQSQDNWAEPVPPQVVARHQADQISPGQTSVDSLIRRLALVQVHLDEVASIDAVFSTLQQAATEHGRPTLAYSLAVARSLLDLAGTVARGDMDSVHPVDVMSLILQRIVPRHQFGRIGEWLDETCHSIQSQVEERLREFDWIVIRPRIGSSFDPAMHKCTGHTATDDPTMARRIVEVEAPGLRVRGKLEVPALVKLGTSTS